MKLAKGTESYSCYSRLVSLDIEMYGSLNTSIYTVLNELSLDF